MPVSCSLILASLSRLFVKENLRMRILLVVLQIIPLRLVCSKQCGFWEHVEFAENDLGSNILPALLLKTRHGHQKRRIYSMILTIRVRLYLTQRTQHVFLDNQSFTMV